MAEQLIILDPTEEVFGKCFAHGLRSTTSGSGTPSAWASRRTRPRHARGALDIVYWSPVPISRCRSATPRLEATWC